MLDILSVLLRDPPPAYPHLSAKASDQSIRITSDLRLFTRVYENENVPCQ